MKKYFILYTFQHSPEWRCANFAHLPQYATDDNQLIKTLVGIAQEMKDQNIISEFQVVATVEEY